MIDDKNRLELSKLIIELMEGSIADERLKILDNCLSKYPEALNFYREFMKNTAVLKNRIHISLNDDTELLNSDMWAALAECERTAPATIIPKVEPPRELIQKVVYPKMPPRQVSKFSVYTLIISAAAILFAIIYVQFAPLPATTVATITDSIDAQWAQSEHSVDIGSELWDNEGTRWLHKGIVKIEFDYGAEVIIEGPTAFEMKDEEKMILHSGRLYATVPKRAAGFTVQTPYSTIIDLGTEFGVKVGRDGTTDVHMLKGKASLIPGASRQKGESRELVAGQAVRVNTSAQVQSIPVQKTAFVRQILSPYEMVIRKSQPIAYWRFDEDDEHHCIDSIGTVRPAVKTGVLQTTESPRFNRSQGNLALHFMNYQSKISVPPINRNRFLKRGYTLSAWVRIDSFSAQEGDILSVISTVQKSTGGLSRLLSINNQGHFTHSPVNKIMEGRTKVEIGKWYHVTLTVSANSYRCLFVNGKEDCEAVQFIKPFEEGSNLLKEFNFGATYLGYEPELGFKGALDDVVIWDRVLSAEQIELLYQSAVKVQ